MSTEAARAWVFEASTFAPAGSVRPWAGEPFEITAFGRPVSPARAMATPDDDATRVVALPSGPDLAHHVQEEAVAWVSAAPRGAWPVLDLALRVRVVWSPTRIVLIGAAEALPESLAAALHLTRLVTAVGGIEDRIEALWPRLDGDATRAASVGSIDRREGARIAATMSETLRLRRDLVVAHTLLDGAALSRAPGSLRLFRELALQIGFPERLARLDDPLELMEDLYGGTHERLSEFRYFRAEMTVELLILAVLVAELAALIVDYLS